MSRPDDIQYLLYKFTFDLVKKVLDNSEKSSALRAMGSPVLSFRTDVTGLSLETLYGVSAVISEDSQMIGHCNRRLVSALMRQRPKNRIQNLIEALANVFAEEPQYIIAVLLEQNVFAPITPVSVRIVEVLAAIQFDCYVCACA